MSLFASLFPLPTPILPSPSTPLPPTYTSSLTHALVGFLVMWIARHTRALLRKMRCMVQQHWHNLGAGQNHRFYSFTPELLNHNMNF